MVHYSYSFPWFEPLIVIGALVVLSVVYFHFFGKK